MSFRNLNLTCIPKTKTQQQVALEAYMGKSKELLICEKELDKLLKEVSKDRSYIKYMGQHLTLMENYLAKAFEIKEVKLNFYVLDEFVTVGTSAFTFVNGFSYFDKSISDPNLGPKNIVAGVNISQTFVFSGELSAGELMAIILHEIGHNLYTNTLVYTCKLILNPLGFIFSNLYGIAYNNISTTANRVVIKSDAVNSIYKIYTDIRKGLLPFLRLFQYSLGTIGAIVAFIPSVYAKIGQSGGLLGYYFDHFQAYHNEKFADSIANKYGYGPELATALKKIGQISNYGSSETKLFVPGIDFCNTLIMLLYSSVDPHPKNVTRVHDMLASLKDEVKNNKLDSGQRKALERDIKELENLIKNYDKISKSSEKEILTNAVDKLIAGPLNGIGDIRDLFVGHIKI